MEDGNLDTSKKDQAFEQYDTENPLPTPPMKCTEGLDSIRYTVSIGFTEVEISPMEHLADTLAQFNA